VTTIDAKGLGSTGAKPAKASHAVQANIHRKIIQARPPMLSGRG
jgi:hypothetical protein